MSEFDQTCGFKLEVLQPSQRTHHTDKRIVIQVSEFIVDIAQETRHSLL